MMKKKTIAISIFAALSLFCGGAAVGAIKPIGVHADELFAKNSDIRYEYNAVDANGEKGILVSADKATAFVDFKNTYAGAFELSFDALETQPNTVDFYTLNIDFAPTGGGNVFRFTYTVSDYDDAGAQTAQLKCYWGETPINGVTQTLTETGKTTVGFDSETMTMYYRVGNEENYTLMDFHDASKMASAFSTHNRIPDVETYTVSLSFAGIQADRTAKVMLYAINGQKLMGKRLVNHKGAEVVSAQFYAGVVGKEYVVPQDSVVVCDALSGVLPFAGRITAQAPDGTELTVEDGKFTPTQVGTYSVTLQAKDEDGIYGAKSAFDVTVMARQAQTEIQTSLPMQNATVGKNTSVLLPSAIL